MSAGSFVNSKYQADNGEIHPCRVQPETLTANVGAANSPPAGAVTVPFKARSSGGNRAYGLKMRAVSVRFTGTLPTGYAANQTLRIPILSKAVYDAVVPGETTGTYLTAAIIVVGKLREGGRG
jgi:hypothetical protein